MQIVSSICVLFGVPFTKKVVKHTFIAEMQSDTSDSGDFNCFVYFLVIFWVNC